MKTGANFTYSDHSKSTSANVFVARLVSEDDLRGLPATQVDVLLPGDLAFRAFIEVPFLPLPEDASEGVFYMTPDGEVSYVRDGEWATLSGSGGSEYTIEATDDGWVFKKDGEDEYNYVEPKDHIIVSELPETGIEEQAEYILLDENKGFVATYVHSPNGWVQTTVPVTQATHQFVTELPEVGNEGVEYVLMDDLADAKTYKGTFVYNFSTNEWQTTSGAVQISEEDNNAISMKADGLFAAKPDVDKDYVDSQDQDLQQQIDEQTTKLERIPLIVSEISPELEATSVTVKLKYTQVSTEEGVSVNKVVSFTPATASDAGMMSAADKAKLDDIGQMTAKQFNNIWETA